MTMITANLVQSHFRFRDGGTDTVDAAPTWLAGEDTNIAVDCSGGNVKLRIRFAIQETAGGDDGAAPYGLRSSRDAYAANVATSNTGLRSADVSSDVSGTSVATSRLTGTGTYLAGEYDEDGTTDNITLLASRYTEVEFGIELVAADLTDGDVIDLRCYRSASPMNSYSVTPRITVRKTTGFGKVKHKYRFGQAVSGTSITMAEAVTVAVGDLVIISCGSNSSSVTVGTGSDALGNTVTALHATATGGGGTQVYAHRNFYSIITTAGAFRATIAGLSTANTYGLTVTVFEGAFTALDKDGGLLADADDAAPYPTNSTGTLSQADEMVVALWMGRFSPNVLVDSPFTMAHYANASPATNVADAHATQVVSATTSVSANFTVASGATAASTWIGSFKKETNQALTPSLITNTNTFYSPTVAYTPTFGEKLWSDTASAGSGTGVQVPTGGAVSVGDLVIVSVGLKAAVTNFAVSDNLGNTYTLAANNGGVRRFAWTIVTTAGTCRPQETHDNDSSDVALVAAAFYGPWATSPKDVEPTTTVDTSTPFTCPATGTLAQADELVIGFCDTRNGVTMTGATSPFTLTGQVSTGTGANTVAMAVCHLAVSSTASVTPEFTAGGGAVDASQGTISFKKFDQGALTPSLFTNTNTFYAATVTPGAVDVAPSLISDGDTAYTATVLSTYDLTPNLISDGDTFFSATVTPGAVDLAPSLYSDGDTFFSATVAPGAVDLTPSLVSDGDNVFSATVTTTYDLTPSLVSDADTIYAATVTPGAIDLTPSLVTDGDTFFSASANNSVDLTPSLYSDADTFYTHLVEGQAAGQDLQPSLVSDGDTVHSATVTPGAVDLTPALYSDADTFYAPTVAPGAVDLTPSLYADDDTFYQPTVTQGGVTLSPDLYSDADTFFSATVAAGSVDLQPSLATDGDAVHAATVLGIYDLLPSLVVDGDTVFSATVASTYDLQPALFSDADSVHSATITTSNVLSPSLVTDGETVYSATVAGDEVYAVVTWVNIYAAAGAAILRPQLVADGDTIYSAAVAAGATDLTPSLVSDADTVYSVAVTTTYSLQPSLVSDADTFFSATVTTSYSLTPSLVTDADTFYSAVITPGAVDLTPSPVADADTVFSATVAASNTLLPSLVSDADTVFSATVTAANTLLPSLVSDGDTFYTQLIANEQTLLPSLVTDGDTIYSATVVNSQQLVASLISDADTFFTPAVTTETSLTASLVTDADTVFSATVLSTSSLLPSLVTDTDTIFSATVSVGAVNLQPVLVTDGDTVFEHTATAGGVTLLPSLVTDGDVVYEVTAQATSPLLPSLVTDADAVYSAVVVVGAVVLQPQLVENVNTFYHIWIHTPHELRVVTVSAETRLVYVDQSVRMVTVLASNRIVYVEPEDRVLVIPEMSDEGDVLGDNRIVYTEAEDREVSSTS